jgi:hypothetical protein
MIADLRELEGVLDAERLGSQDGGASDLGLIAGILFLDLVRGTMLAGRYNAGRGRRWRQRSSLP